MLELTQRHTDKAPCVATLTLPYARRQKSRFRARLDTGEAVAVILPRGTVLRGGDQLSPADGTPRIEVIAALEPVCVVTSAEPHDLLRAAYHLGNRHIELQIDETSLRLLVDHVLEDMLRGLGVRVLRQQLPFEPESGAYASGGHHHAHDDHDHDDHGHHHHGDHHHGDHHHGHHHHPGDDDGDGE